MKAKTTIPNLRAEQARHGIRDKDIAKKLGMPPSTYAFKKLHRTLSIDDAFTLCELFECDFEYLFAKDTSDKRD